MSDKPERPTCATCPYWNPCGIDEGNVEIGACIIRSPLIIAQDYVAAKAQGYDTEESLRFASRFPVLYFHDCCGEHPDFPAWIKATRADVPTQCDVAPQVESAIKRLCAGDKMTDVACSLGKWSSGLRKQVLQAFKRRNPGLYRSLADEHDYGCAREPSMRLLLSRARDFGFNG